MTNRAQRRSQMPPGAKRGIKEIVEKISEAAEAKRLAREEDEATELELNDDLNILPFPISQTIDQEYGEITWKWDTWSSPEPETSPQVIAILETRVDRYTVKIEGSTSLQDSLSPENAKMLGQALVSAWNWKEIWQSHAGSFLLKSMSGDSNATIPVVMSPIEEYEPEIVNYPTEDSND